MTKDDIIRMAREAGIDAEQDTLCRYNGWVEPLERFAALVAVAARKPLTEEDIEQAYRHIYRNVPADFDHTSMGWIEHGIRYAEQAHGIKGKE